MSLWYVTAAIAWVNFGLTGAGFLIAFEQKSWPELWKPSDAVCWYVMALFGPACFLVGVMESRHGWTLNPFLKRDAPRIDGHGGGEIR